MVAILASILWIPVIVTHILFEDRKEKVFEIF